MIETKIVIKICAWLVNLRKKHKNNEKLKETNKRKGCFVYAGMQDKRDIP